MKHITIFRDETIYSSHASVCQAKNGDVLVAFRQAPLEQVFAHVHPDSSIGLTRSRDMGKTWEAATTVFDPGEGMNINDPSLTTLRDGTIVLSAFILPAPRQKGEWGDRALTVRGNDYYHVRGEQRALVLRSFDHGVTWDGPYDVDTSAYGHGSGGVFANVAELDDGTILMPVTESSKDGGAISVLMASRDKCKSWEPYAEMSRWNDSEDPRCFGLPSVVHYGGGEMAGVGWSIAKSGTFVTRSTDSGLTWSPLEEVDTNGACMLLSVTDRGTTIMSYGFRNPPYGIRVVPSYDRGRTWDMKNAAALRSDGAMRDLGYPWTTQLTDGSLFCVYYFNVHDEDKSYYDEAASMALCEKWNLAPDLYTFRTAGLRFIGATIFTEDEMRELAGSAVEAEVADQGPTLL